MGTEAMRGPRLRGAVACAAVICLALFAWHGAARSEAGGLRYCSPIVTNAGPGYSKASLYIISGRTDCEKSRKVIAQALSPSSYKQRRIQGWDCASTTRAGHSELFGARCEMYGEEEREVIKSTVPHRCPDCHGVRD